MTGTTTIFGFQELPTLDIENGILRAWWFEPFQATVCFGVFIHLYWYYERSDGLSSNNKFADTVGFSLGPLFNSFLAYWIGIYLWKRVVPPAGPEIPDGIPHNITELGILTAEVASGITLYDAIFFFIHWAMHELPIPWFKAIHKTHHSRPELTVETRDVLRHSILDGSLQVLVNIMVQRTTPWGAVKSRLGRALHNILVIWMLTESHSASPYPNIWRRWFVGVREHRLHHLGMGAKRYQQFFGYLDDIHNALSNTKIAETTTEANVSR